MRKFLLVLNCNVSAVGRRSVALNCILQQVIIVSCEWLRIFKLIAATMLKRLLRPALQIVYKKPTKLILVTATTVTIASQSCQWSKIAECQSFSDKQLEGVLDKINRGIDQIALNTPFYICPDIKSGLRGTRYFIEFSVTG